MRFDTSIFLYVAILIGVIAFVEGVYFLVSDLRWGGGKQVSRRLRSMAQQKTQQTTQELLRPKALGEGASPWVRSMLDSRPVRSFDNLIATSGLNLSTEQALLRMTIFVVVVFWALDLFGGLGIFWCVLWGLVLGLAIPVFVLSRIRLRRVRRLSAQLPDALDMVVRSLRAGHPIATGIEMVSSEMPDPIRTEFGLVFDGMSYGSDLKSALEKMGRRLNLSDVNYMIVAMRIQHGTGGNLAEILGSLAAVMRERQKLYAKVKALSAEARLSAKILAALPVAVVGLLVVISPHFYDAARTNTALALILALAAGLSVTGIILLRAIVDIRV